MKGTAGWQVTRSPFIKRGDSDGHTQNKTKKQIRK